MRTTPWQEGSPESRICFVPEAPGRSEIIQSRPLVGPAGRLFDELLHKAGLVRAEVEIQNTVREQISDVKMYLSRRGLTDRGQEAAADLRSRLEHSKANVFVPMGNLALCALTGRQAITKLRGSPLESTLLPGRKVIPCIHPAATLGYQRGPYVWRYMIVHDIQKAARHSESSALHLRPRQLLLNPSHKEALDFLRMLRTVRRIAFDIEIYNHQVSCISFAPDPDVSMSIPMTDRWSTADEAEIWLRIADVLGDPRIGKIGQFVTFDISFLHGRNRIRTRGPIYDTYIASRILYPDFPASLEFLTSIYTDEPYYKDDRKMWNKIDQDPMRFWAYNAKDSAVTYECWPPLSEEMHEGGYAHDYNMTIRMLEPCLYMMQRGVRIDVPALEAAKAEVREDLDTAEKELTEVAEAPFNPGSSKQCIRYFYGIKGLKPYINRKTGNPTCDDKALARIVRKYNLPEARLVQRIRALRKLNDTYLDLQYDADGRLRCFYNIRGAGTGRLSSSKTVFGTGLNMQNLHPRFKGFLVTDDDMPVVRD